MPEDKKSMINIKTANFPTSSTTGFELQFSI
ncbi:unnamed protein product, partial [Brugia timori]